MRKMLEGVRYYQAHIFDRRFSLFTKLVQEQKPYALFITCSDSRIDPESLTGSDPGDIFVIRNAGAIVPRHGACQGAVGAEVELAVKALGVKHIVICGHTRCAAVGGILFPERINSMPTLGQWLKSASTDLSDMELSISDRTVPAPMPAIEKHVRTQLENLVTYPSVAEAIAEDRLELHGWIYHLENGGVTAYERQRDQFLHYEEAYASLLAEPLSLAGHRS